nr:reverse transcriptase domain-containing protein [Tanacetum cinerariifolium]
MDNKSPIAGHPSRGKANGASFLSRKSLHFHLVQISSLEQTFNLHYAHKCPELAKRYSDKVSQTVDEMMVRLDDFVRLEEALTCTKLPKGEYYIHKKLDRVSHPERTTCYIGRTLGQIDEGTMEGTPITIETFMPLTGPKITTFFTHRPEPEKKKRKTTKQEESWMNVPITFPPISSEDIFDEHIIVEAEVEGYLVRQIYVDEGASVEMEENVVRLGKSLVTINSPGDAALANPNAKEGVKEGRNREVVLEGLELRDVGCPIHFEDVIRPKIVIK